MTTPPIPPSAMPPAYPGPPYPRPPAAPSKQRNTLGLIAVVAAVVGFVFACIPGALIVGWVLLPIAFVLGIVGVCQSGKTKGTSIAAIIISIVGTVVGFVVFFAVVSDAFDEAFSSDVSVVTPAAPGQATDSDAAARDTPGSRGTRADPYPLGSVIADGDWRVTVNSVTPNANGAVAEENPFNDAPPAGSQYLLVNVTITYTGTDPQGKTPLALISYVTVDGNTLDAHDNFVVAPDALDTLSPLFEGASTTGNLAFAVPSASATQGTLAVQPTMFADKVFVAVR
ncbi:DUF4352 domain-containing protein [Nocardia farcinica]|uniref:DUF4352 domain-containing protein n=1 Tax=Nocardia farcinica TaxID=37329 RepID=UPI0018956EB0|nr:DUF4352 domain-containing protein [Nocardia farcinica]MBF6267568.1 DUF4352 domain-containing protein [Nocardia farcinica]MCZ9327046.1 DUF4352 domain-containing protein [Nocardia farcinica]